MKWVTLLLLLAIVVRIEVFSQISLFFEVQGNYTVIPTYEKDVTPNIIVPTSSYYFIYPEYNLQESYKSKPGVNLLLGIRKEVFRKISFEMGLGFSLSNYQRTIKIDKDTENQLPIISPNIYPGVPIGTFYPAIGGTSTEPGTIKYIDLDSLRSTGNPILGKTENDGNTSIYYFAIPLDINYMILKGRLSIGAGISTSFLVHSRQTYTQLNIDYAPYYGAVDSDRWLGVDTDEETYIPRIKLSEKVDKSGTGLEHVVWSSAFNAQYRIFNNIWINAAYQQSFTPIYESENRSVGDAKNRMIRLGLRYYISGSSI